LERQTSALDHCSHANVCLTAPRLPREEAKHTVMFAKFQKAQNNLRNGVDGCVYNH